ncbi:ABC transporter substrate-binding protein [Oryzibacter oryziterrae]|uniref:ABC transporter substrate-binding protein n=1 Tax=Oryzibacter oryziterrae TaxID=2766474 RepID=UPI001F2CDADE|nr:ABC transporter substrate-binding protein [Oryzibacter oryziterrae]
MKKLLGALLGGAALFAVSGSAMAGEKCDVIHWWTSGGEAAAVAEFAKAFNAAGGEWIDTAIAGGGGDNARAVGIPRIMAGDPPCAMQFNYGKQFDELVSNGFLRNLDDAAKAGGWEAATPPITWGQIQRDGHVMAVPVNIHGSNWSWWSKAALEKAGATMPTNWDEVWVALDKLKAAGITPVAASGQAWQLDMMFQFMVLSIAGNDTFKAVYGDHSEEAVKSDAFKQAIAAFLKVKNYIDAGSANRNWNDASAMVINGTAGVQFMGDWAKGEFVSAGKTEGTDYYCKTTFSDKKGYIFGGDIFVFPVSKNADTTKAQDLLMNTMFSKETQVAFNLKKGSAPVRQDVDTSKVDPCGQEALKLIANPATQVAGADATNTPDAVNAMRDVLASQWTDPNATVDTFVEKFVPALMTDM